MQIWCLQSECETVIQIKLQPAVFIGLDFPFYRFLYCFAVCYKKIHDSNQKRRTYYVDRQSLFKNFLKSGHFLERMHSANHSCRTVFLWLSRGRFKHFCLTLDWV